MNTRIPDLIKAGVVAILFLCIAASPVFGADVSENGSFSDEQPMLPEIISIGVTPGTADIPIGGTQQFTAVACDASGQTIPDTEFVWESGNETVGTVDGSGLFTALSEGAVTISAVNGDVSGTCNVTVTEISDPESSEEGIPDEEIMSEVSLIEITPGNVDLFVSEIQLFTAAAYDGSGSELSGTAIVWEISDETIGTVDNSGLFTAVSPGTVAVSAYSGNISASSIITVSEAEVPTVTPEPTPGSIAAVMASVTSFDGGIIPAVDDVYLKVANDDGARFNDFGNDTFHILWTGGGVNAVHISDSPSGEGEVTNTNSQSGTFYVTETGGRGYHDEVFLCVAVNGTIPDNFKLHILADGYQWVPNPIPHMPPVSGTAHYEPVTLDEWFEKDDLMYGPQNWRPAVGTQYPLFAGQDMSDTSNTFRMMFIDLNGGILSAHSLRVQYEIENLNTMASFNVYAYTKNEEKTTGIFHNITSWTNNVVLNGWSVSGVPLPDAASITISPASAEVPKNGKQQFFATAYGADGNEINGAPITWSSSDESIGTIDSDGLFTPTSEGSTIITANAASGVSQTAVVNVIAAVERVLTEITLDPSEVVMYTDQIGNRTFNATGYDQFSDEITPLTFTWSSTVPAVGSIDQTGFFTGKTEGMTIISATNGSVSQTAMVEIKQHPDWNVTLIGAINRTLNRTDIIDLSSGGMASNTDNGDIFWEGVNLTAVLGLVDDDDPTNFNEELALREYTISLKGKKAGIDKEINIISTDLLDPDKDIILAYKMNGYEIPEELEGRNYWPLKLTGSGIVYSGKNLEEISEISITFGPDVNAIVITPSDVDLWTGDEPVQFSAEAYDRAGIKLSDISFTWASGDESVGTVDESGFFSPLGDGETEVSAYAWGITANANVTVRTPGTEPVTRYVDGTGVGDFLTIQDAVDYAYDNDVIVVRDGTYREKVVVDRPMTIISANGPDNTIVSPEPYAKTKVPVFTVTSDHVTISGLGIENAYDYHGIDLSGYNYCVVENNIINNTIRASSCKASGVAMESSNYTVVKNNTIYSQRYGIMVSTASPGIIECNTISSDVKYSIGAVISSNSDNFTINGNTIDMVTTSKVYALMLNTEVNDIHVEGNTFSGGIDTVYLYKAQNVTFLKNQIIGGGNYKLHMKKSNNVTVLDNEISGAERYGLYTTNCYNLDVQKNNITGTGRSALYLTYSSYNIVMNNLIDSQSSNGLFYKATPGSLNSTSPVSYTYMNETFTGFIGNYYSTYTGLDIDGDGVGDTPYIEDDMQYYHPLVSPIENYVILEATSINVTPPTTILEVGESMNFTTEIIDQRGEILSSAVPVWSSSNPAVGAVDATTGCFEALSPGDVIITATCGDCTGSADVTVVKMTKKTETTLFNLANCTFSDDGNGGLSVSVNASAATLGNNSIFMQGNGFNLAILTPSPPVTAGGRITGDVDEVILETTPITADLQSPGNVSASISANLTGLPTGAGITTTITQTISNDTQSAFQIAATADGLNLDAVAYTMNIVKTNLTNGEDISDAAIRMSVSPAWVAANGGYDAITIIRFAEDGTKEVLDTEYLGFDGELDQFEAFSPNGLSIFGLSATSVIPAPQPGFPSSSSGGSGGASGSIATARCDGIHAGEMGTFILDKTAITEVDVKAGMNIPSMMLTAEKISAPSKIAAAPAEVYQYIEITSYLAPKDSMEMATLRFSVDTDWLDSLGATASDVKMYRYDEETGDWAVLSTVADGKGASCCNFFADTPSFSLFAITAEKGTASPVSGEPADLPQPTAASTDAPGTAQPTPTDAQTPVQTNADNSAFVIIVVIAIIAACAGAYWWNKSGKK